MSQRFRSQLPLAVSSGGQVALQRQLNAMQDAVERGMKEKWFLSPEPFRGVHKLNSVAKEFLCEAVLIGAHEA